MAELKRLRPYLLHCSWENWSETPEWWPCSWGTVLEKIFKPEESLAPLQVWTITAHKAATWGLPLQHNHAVHKESLEGFPLPLLTKKSPCISRLLFRAPSAAVWWGGTPAWVLVMGVGGRMLVLGTGGRWDRGPAWGTARNVAKDSAHRSTDAWINCLLFTARVYCSAFN